MIKPMLRDFVLYFAAMVGKLLFTFSLAFFGYSAAKLFAGDLAAGVFVVLFLTVAITALWFMSMQDF